MCVCVYVIREKMLKSSRVNERLQLADNSHTHKMSKMQGRRKEGGRCLAEALNSTNESVSLFNMYVPKGTGCMWICVAEAVWEFKGWAHTDSVEPCHAPHSVIVGTLIQLLRFRLVPRFPNLYEKFMLYLKCCARKQICHFE